MKYLAAILLLCASTAHSTTYLPFKLASSGAASSLILHTDINAGPTTGGENSKGTYLGIYGLALATQFSDLGTTTKVYVCGTEVDNYRVLDSARTTGIPGVNTATVQRLIVQVGALGSPTAGVECKIDIKTNGTSTPANTTDGSGFYLDMDSQRLSFTPQPGPIVFISLSGNDANAGTIASPQRHLQAVTAGNYTGALYTSGTSLGVTQSNSVVPGTHVIVRGGTWTDTVNLAGHPNSWADIWQITGTAPNGASSGSPVTIGAVNVSNVVSGTSSRCRYTVTSTANILNGTPITAAGIAGATGTACNTTGTSVVVNGTTVEISGTTFAGSYSSGGTVGVSVQAAGPIVVMSYPGAAGANSPELAFWQGGSGVGGGINGQDTARAEQVTPWGFTGAAQYMNFVNMKIIPNAGTSDAGACPINMQAGAHFWRIVNNELSWPSSGIQAQCGGVAGNGHFPVIYGNYVHDVSSSIAQENHCIYFDGSQGATQDNYTDGAIVAYNVLVNCTGGNGIQVYDNYTAHAATNFNFHNNWIDTTVKHGINLSANSKSGKVWNNVVMNVAVSSVALDPQSAVTGSNAIVIAENTFYAFNTSGLSVPYCALNNFGNIGSGSVLAQNNIIMQNSAATGTYCFFESGSGTFNVQKNFWYDASGALTTKPAADSTGSYVNPQLTNVATKNFIPGVSSTAPNSAAAPNFPVVKDFLYTTRPQGSNTNNTIGALERPGG